MVRRQRVGPLWTRQRGAGGSRERERDILRGLKALGRILLHAVADDALQSEWNGGIAARPLRIVFQNRTHRFGGRLAVERAPSAEHLVDDGAQAEDIGPVIGRGAAHLLGRHVADGAEHKAGLRIHRGHRGHSTLPARNVRLFELREPEIENLRARICRDEQVLGFEVPMHDAFFVRSREPVGDLQRQFYRLARWQCAVLETRAQRFPVQQF